jgi:hypothetical protein
MRLQALKARPRWQLLWTAEGWLYVAAVVPMQPLTVGIAPTASHSTRELLGMRPECLARPQMRDGCADVGATPRSPAGGRCAAYVQ